MKTIVERHKNIGTVKDLKVALDELVCADINDVYVRSRSGESICLALEEETLTDGSIVYNIIFMADSPESQLRVGL